MSTRHLATSAAVFAALLGACGSSSNPGGPLDRPILGFDEARADAANHALLPAGFTTPLQTACSSDTTRAFIAELADHPPNEAMVLFHWAPVVPGPIAGKPTVAQPELYASGEVTSINHSALDTSFDHPFGFDFNMDVKVDAPFRMLVKTRDPAETDLHAEIEEGIFPEAAFGFVPALGDRVLMKGAWIFDCGHPPYETEMHPPSFLAFARAQDPRSTISLAFVSPYRVTQLFGSAAQVADFANANRFNEAGEPFPRAFTTEIVAAAAQDKDHLEAHVLLEATHFDTLTWSVCAPSPRPPAVSLRFTHRFTARTGVTVNAVPSDASGCVVYTATMSAAYTPAVPLRQDHPWPWSEISQQASDESGVTIDVRRRIIDALRSAGVTGDIRALHEDHPPVIDRYAPLQPRADAAQDAPLAVTTGADDQPYPFHGRARVFWQ